MSYEPRHFCFPFFCFQPSSFSSYPTLSFGLFLKSFFSVDNLFNFWCNYILTGSPKSECIVTNTKYKGLDRLWKKPLLFLSKFWLSSSYIKANVCLYWLLDHRRIAGWILKVFGGWYKRYYELSWQVINGISEGAVTHRWQLKPKPFRLLWKKKTTVVSNMNPQRQELTCSLAASLWTFP